MIKASSFEDYLSSCPSKDMNQFLTTECYSDGCHQEKTSIFLDKDGHFRKPLKVTFLCNSSNRLCSEYQRRTDYKVSDETRMTCRRNTFENFDSMESLRCNWNNETTEQVQCMQNIFQHSYTGEKILCCTTSQSTVFRSRRLHKGDLVTKLCWLQCYNLINKYL